MGGGYWGRFEFWNVVGIVFGDSLVLRVYFLDREIEVSEGGGFFFRSFASYER